MTAVPVAPSLRELPAGFQLRAGLGVSTILPDMDVETFSAAGFVWDRVDGKWTCLPGAPGSKKGLPIVGAAVYATHESTELLSLAYNLKDGYGQRRWRQGDPPPLALFQYIAAGGLLECWNSGFEHWIWNQHCVPILGWPPLPLAQLRCCMAKARAHAMPGKLEKFGEVARLKIQKDKEGARLLKKFSIPRDPTKKDPRTRIRLDDDPADAHQLFNYNGTDIETEAEASSILPDLSPDELAYWLCDQEINYRGVAVDVAAVDDCISVVEQVFEKYNGRLRVLTGGAVEQGSQTERLKTWLLTRGVQMFAMDEEAVDAMLADTWIPNDAREALEIRGRVASASIKKLFTIRNQKSKWQRIHDLINYHAARTGRDGGQDAQTQNLPKFGPKIFGPSKKWAGCCGHYWGAHRHQCPWCGFIVPPTLEPQEWSAVAHADAFTILSTRSLDIVEAFYGDAFTLIIGCLRGLFIAATGHELIASDYSAIEAVVNAALSGCEWRLDVFRTGKDIYYASAAKITGKTYEYYEKYKAENNKHHPDRQPFGKVAELSSGYGGYVGAWVQFGADEYFTEAEIKQHVMRWRAESPEIVEFWGGQFRGNPFRPATVYREYFGLEGMAIQAVLYPGQRFTYHANHKDARPITYVVYGDVLYCILPSGRPLAYHKPRLIPASKGPWAQHGALSLTFFGWNTNAKMGPFGWICMDTYGGKLCENVVQAVSRDILRDAVIRFRDTIYKIVLRVHDELVAEKPIGLGSLEEYERIMAEMPWWAFGWPIFAKGGWIGPRYLKD